MIKKLLFWILKRLLFLFIGFFVWFAFSMLIVWAFSYFGAGKGLIFLLVSFIALFYVRRKAKREMRKLQLAQKVEAEPDVIDSE